MGIETSEMRQRKIQRWRKKVNRYIRKGVSLWIQLWYHCASGLGTSATVNTVAMRQRWRYTYLCRDRGDNGRVGIFLSNLSTQENDQGENIRIKVIGVQACNFEN